MSEANKNGADVSHGDQKSLQGDQEEVKYEKDSSPVDPKTKSSRDVVKEKVPCVMSQDFIAQQYDVIDSRRFVCCRNLRKLCISFGVWDILLYVFWIGANIPLLISSSYRYSTAKNIKGSMTRDQTQQLADFLFEFAIGNVFFSFLYITLGSTLIYSCYKRNRAVLVFYLYTFVSILAINTINDAILYNVRHQKVFMVLDIYLAVRCYVGYLVYAFKQNLKVPRPVVRPPPNFYHPDAILVQSESHIYDYEMIDRHIRSVDPDWDPSPPPEELPPRTISAAAAIAIQSGKAKMPNFDKPHSHPSTTSRKTKAEQPKSET